MQGRCTEHNAVVHMHQHRTQHDSTDILNTEHMVHTSQMHRAQHQSTDAPNTMVHTSHMEVHQAGGGSMALIKLNRLRLITEGGKFLNDPTFGT